MLFNFFVNKVKHFFKWDPDQKFVAGPKNSILLEEIYNDLDNKIKMFEPKSLR